MTAVPKTILLVEDNPDDLELALRALKRHTSAEHVTVARDGVEALDCLIGETPSRLVPVPSLLVLDIRLPRLGGLEVVRRVRSHQPTRHLPIVMLTSSAEPSDILDAYAAGVNAYVRKPITFEHFVETMRAIAEFWLRSNVTPAIQDGGRP